MQNTILFQSLLDEIKPSLILPPDQPDETIESTLKALWHTASGNPCSAKLATSISLVDLTEEQTHLLRELVSRRLGGTPLMQITGRAHFMGLELEFTPDVFIIRPETELLGYSTVELLSNHNNPLMIEVGCGSGNLTCGIASSIPKLSVYAVDILKSCVDLTNRNILKCNLSNRVNVMLGNLFDPLSELDLNNKIDAIVCNPPYIASSRLKGDRAYLVNHEPLEAFDGGPFGFRMHQLLISESLRFLKPGGSLLFEFGAGQDKQILGLFNRAGGYGPINFKLDHNGTARVVIARKAA